MAIISQKFSVEEANDRFLFYSSYLDEQEWLLDDSIVYGKKFDNTIFLQAQQIYNVVFDRFFKEVKPQLTDAVSSKAQHFENKISNFKKKLDLYERKLATSEPVGITVPHEQFIKSTSPSIQPPLTISSSKPTNINVQAPVKVKSGEIKQEEAPQASRVYKPISFKTEKVNNNQPILSPLQILERVSYLFRHGNEQQAVAEFSTLPLPLQQQVYEALWIVRGKPMNNNPIAHPNFGEVSLKNTEARCASTLQQKACAVELAKIPAALLEIASAFENNNQALANQIFTTLPPQIQNELFGKHWEEMGRPTGDSPDEYLRSISHHNFGQVSLLGQESRCNVPLNRKANAVKTYLSDYKAKIDALQGQTQTIQSGWEQTDLTTSMRGLDKNKKKKDDLDKLANSFIPQFLGQVAIAKLIPKGESFQSYADAYVNAYPCLRPFFLQLVPKLDISNETLIQGQAPMVSKPSQVPSPNLSMMTDPDRRKHLVSIMDDTLETLQKGGYVNSKGEKITLDLQPAMASLTPFQSTSVKTGDRLGQYRTVIFLNHQDCLTVTRRCIQDGLNPICLDAASEEKFGGGYKTGARAQEENITRRSALSQVVDPTQGLQSQNFYPLQDKCLYVSNVPVFRGEEREGYPYLDQPFEAAFAITAAPNFNEEHLKRISAQTGVTKTLSTSQTGELCLPIKEAEETKQKLRTVLHMAQEKGHDAVVLVAFGCGAFRNPPKHVCEIMMELITQEFPHSFKEIHISIIEDQNSGRAHNPNGNYAVFKETIEKLFIPTINWIGAKFVITQ